MTLLLPTKFTGSKLWSFHFFYFFGVSYETSLHYLDVRLIPTEFSQQSLATYNRISTCEKSNTKYYTKWIDHHKNLVINKLLGQPTYLFVNI